MGVRRVDEKSIIPGRGRIFEIDVDYAEEGVWRATSPDVPGLYVEGETVEEAIAEARLWAPELLRANGAVTDTRTVELVFKREGEPLFSK